MKLVDALKAILHLPSNLKFLVFRINSLNERVEFLRSEILYEVKYGARQSASEQGRVEPRILDPEKISRQAVSGLKLNLGCGHVPLDGYVNVDMRAIDGVDVVAAINDLPFAPGAVAEIRSQHVLEHFPQEYLRRTLLPHWRSLLKPGGVLKATVPDGEAMVAHAAAGDYSFEDFRDVLFGSQDYDGDFHFNMFTPQSLSDLMQEAGFDEMTVPVRGRANGRCYEFSIEARRPD